MALQAPTPIRRPRRTLIENLDQLGGVFRLIEQIWSNPNFGPLLDSIENHLQELHEEYFNSESDPTGKQWQPLAESTERQKGYGIRLVRSGSLKESFIGTTGESIREKITEGGNSGIVFGTSNETAGYHQSGTQRMPARPLVGVSEQVADSIANAIADDIVAQLVG